MLSSILLVEDHDELREVVQACFEDAGYECITSKTVRSALSTIEHTGWFDAVVTDLLMPGESALALIEACRSRSIPVAVLTGLAEDTARQICPAGIPIMSKPLDIEDMLAVIRGIIAGPGDSPSTHDMNQSIGTEDWD